MANRYANLIGTKKISEDFNTINIGFDRVQTEMDTKGTPQDAQTKADAAKQAAIDAAAAALTSHKQRGADEHPTAKGNAAGFMSAADKLKSDASTNAATPDTLMQRDAAGRAKVTAPVAADDIARKAETDAVQSNLDSHAADTDIHVTAEDHAKLDGIAEGAEINQNAFAKVNDVEASTKSDTVTFVGGTGIAVTTNPSTKQVTVTATGTATPGAHASSHVTGGSDVIPDAVTDGASGLMSGSDAKFVRVDGESKTGAQAKADAVKDYIESRLDNPERASITLQPGIHVVQADQDAAFKLAGLQGRTVLNYQSQIGIFGVLNPYVIRYGENLIPPFYEWTLFTGAILNAPYNLTYSYVSGNASYNLVNLPTIPGQTYTLTVNNSAANARNVMNFYGEDGTQIQGTIISGTATPTNAGVNTVTYQAPPGAKTMRTHLYGDPSSSGTISFTNPMLTLGNKVKPFVPREDSMIALQTDLHANPDTGANPDMVFERDGQYFKLAKWRKVVLDGGLNWIYVGTNTGTKTVGVNALVDSGPDVYRKTVMTKYNGSLIKSGEISDLPAGDAGYIYGNSFRLSIKSADSGWGDSYTPTTDEIKAYFMGWKMYDVNTNPDGSGVYNRTDGVGKWFVPIDRSSGGVNLLPTTKVPTVASYQLLYQLVTPAVEPITSEGQLTFIEGDNQVEVGTGIVLRELAKPQASPNYYNVNASSLPMGRLSKAVSRYLGVYKSGRKEPWEFVAESYNGIGFVRLPIALYDPSAAYSVTYLMLDKYPTANFDGTYAENEKALLLDTVKSIQENTARISVLESKKAEKDSPAWITPTLVNGWIQYPGYPTAQYVKDSNEYVNIRGLIKGGVRDAGKRLFVLPEGFRPKTRRIFNVLSFGTTTPIGTTVEITEDGNVYLGTSASETWLNLEGISFNASL